MPCLLFFKMLLSSPFADAAAALLPFSLMLLMLLRFADAAAIAMSAAADALMLSDDAAFR